MNQIRRLTMRAIALLLAIVLFGCSSQGDGNLLLDAEEFARSYNKYKGKELTIKGRFVREPVVLVINDGGTIEQDEVVLEGTSELRIWCKIAKASRKHTKSLDEAKEITIRGTCGGRTGSAILM